MRIVGSRKDSTNGGCCATGEDRPGTLEDPLVSEQLRESRRLLRAQLGDTPAAEEQWRAGLEANPRCRACQHFLDDFDGTPRLRG